MKSSILDNGASAEDVKGKYASLVSSLVGQYASAFNGAASLVNYTTQKRSLIPLNVLPSSDSTIPAVLSLSAHPATIGIDSPRHHSHSDLLRALTLQFAEHKSDAYVDLVLYLDANESLRLSTASIEKGGSFLLQATLLYAGKCNISFEEAEHALLVDVLKNNYRVLLVLDRVDLVLEQLPEADRSHLVRVIDSYTCIYSSHEPLSSLGIRLPHGEMRYRWSSIVPAEVHKLNEIFFPRSEDREPSDTLVELVSKSVLFRARYPAAEDAVKLMEMGGRFAFSASFKINYCGFLLRYVVDVVTQLLVGPGRESQVFTDGLPIGRLFEKAKLHIFMLDYLAYLSYCSELDAVAINAEHVQNYLRVVDPTLLNGQPVDQAETCLNQLVTYGHFIRKIGKKYVFTSPMLRDYFLAHFWLGAALVNEEAGVFDSFALIRHQPALLREIALLERQHHARVLSAFPNQFDVFQQAQEAIVFQTILVHMSRYVHSSNEKVSQRLFKFIFHEAEDVYNLRILSSLSFLGGELSEELSLLHTETEQFHTNLWVLLKILWKHSNKYSFTQTVHPLTQAFFLKHNFRAFTAPDTFLHRILQSDFSSQTSCLFVLQFIQIADHSDVTLFRSFVSCAMPLIRSDSEFCATLLEHLALWREGHRQLETCAKENTPAGWFAWGVMVTSDLLSQSLSFHNFINSNKALSTTHLSHDLAPVVFSAILNIYAKRAVPTHTDGQRLFSDKLLTTINTFNEKASAKSDANGGAISMMSVQLIRYVLAVKPTMISQLDEIEDATSSGSLLSYLGSWVISSKQLKPEEKVLSHLKKFISYLTSVDAKSTQTPDHYMLRLKTVSDLQLLLLNCAESDGCDLSKFKELFSRVVNVINHVIAAIIKNKALTLDRALEIICYLQVLLGSNLPQEYKAEIQKHYKNVLEPFHPGIRKLLFEPSANENLWSQDAFILLLDELMKCDETSQAKICRTLNVPKEEALLMLLQQLSETHCERVDEIYYLVESIAAQTLWGCYIQSEKNVPARRLFLSLIALRSIISGHPIVLRSNTLQYLADEAQSFSYIFPTDAALSIEVVRDDLNVINPSLGLSEFQTSYFKTDTFVTSERVLRVLQTAMVSKRDDTEGTLALPESIQDKPSGDRHSSSTHTSGASADYETFESRSSRASTHVGAVEGVDSTSPTSDTGTSVRTVTPPTSMDYLGTTLNLLDRLVVLDSTDAKGKTSTASKSDFSNRATSSNEYKDFVRNARLLQTTENVETAYKGFCELVRIMNEESHTNTKELAKKAILNNISNEATHFFIERYFEGASEPVQSMLVFLFKKRSNIQLYLSPYALSLVSRYIEQRESVGSSGMMHQHRARV